jgi:hypothetical protein
MKQSKLSIIFLLCIFYFIQPTYTMIETRSLGNTLTLEKQKKELKKEFRIQKKFDKFNKFFKKNSIDINDPVKKWLWFALGFGLASIALSIFFGGVLAGIAWSAAGVCLIIWLLKYLQIV